MEIKLNKQQARQFAFDWYDIIVSSIAKEECDKEIAENLLQEEKGDGGTYDCE